MAFHRQSLGLRTRHIMSYCREKNPAPSSVMITFPYKGVSFSRMSIEVQAAISTVSGVRAVGSSFLNLSSCRMRQDSEGISAVILTLDINNPNSASTYASDVPFGTSLEAVRKLAGEIQTQASEPRKQLRLLNDYLIKNVRYGESNGINRACSPVGTMLDGEAVCSGYSSTVNDVCYLLGIPAYQLYDRPNNHIWNVVFVDGEWLMLDVTQNDSLREPTRFFLLPDFYDEYHFYVEESKTLLSAQAMKLNEARFAAQKLSEAGLLHGDGAGNYALARTMTYEELAVILTRLDGAEAQVLANGSTYALSAADSDCQPWAAAYIGYCMEQGYFGESLNLAADNRVTTDAAAQVMSRHATTAKIGLLNDVPTTGEYLLRGSFFCMIADKMP